jgi:hypothetical protein
MPKYHFNVDDGQAPIPCAGAELKNLAEAKCEAVKMMGQLICDAGGAFWDRSEWRMTVTDEAGLSLFELYILGTDAPAARSAA